MIAMVTYVYRLKVAATVPNPPFVTHYDKSVNLPSCERTLAIVLLVGVEPTLLGPSYSRVTITLQKLLADGQMTFSKSSPSISSLNRLPCAGSVCRLSFTDL